MAAATSDVPPPPETIEVESMVVACDGGPLGHPRVYINLRKDGTGECGYCDRRFVLKKGARAAGH